MQMVTFLLKSGKIGFCNEHIVGSLWVVFGHAIQQVKWGVHSEPETSDVRQTCEEENDDDGVDDGKPMNLNITHS